jgi:7-cyano-7-deazaguanine synthase in queuosine biosynthesis
MNKPVNLLWTSGWDSTFRFLHLVLVQQKTVQPYYIKSHTRKSCQMEIETMDRIKEALFKKDPAARNRVLPTIYKERSEIKENAILTEKFHKILQTNRLGDQYEYLARYADEIGINDLELGVDMVTPGFFHNNIKPRMVQLTEGEGHYNYRLQDNPDNPALTLFSYFRFPIPHYTKLDLQKMSTEHGFIDIMDHTWFCHSPINGQPCGLCHPCEVTIEHGMRRRIPLPGQVRHFVQHHLKPPIRKLLRLSGLRASVPTA